MHRAGWEMFTLRDQHHGRPLLNESCFLFSKGWVDVMLAVGQEIREALSEKRFILSYLILSYLILSYLILYYIILYYIILYYIILYYIILYYIILYEFIFFHALRGLHAHRKLFRLGDRRASCMDDADEGFVFAEKL